MQVIKKTVLMFSNGTKQVFRPTKNFDLIEETTDLSCILLADFFNSTNCKHFLG